MDAELRAALDKVIAADKEHKESTDKLNAAIAEFVNVAVSKAKTT